MNYHTVHQCSECSLIPENFFEVIEWSKFEGHATNFDRERLWKTFGQHSNLPMTVTLPRREVVFLVPAKHRAGSRDMVQAVRNTGGKWMWALPVHPMSFLAWLQTNLTHPETASLYSADFKIQNTTRQCCKLQKMEHLSLQGLPNEWCAIKQLLRFQNTTRWRVLVYNNFFPPKKG